MAIALTPSVDQMSWIAGEWVGALGPQRVEEFWSEPRLGCIENKVRLSDPDAVALIELMMVREAQTDDGEPTLTLCLRQFDRDLTPLREQLMVLAALGENSVRFEDTAGGHIKSLGYRECAPGVMQIEVDLRAGPVVVAEVARPSSRVDRS